MDIWTYVRSSAKITAWHRNYLVLVTVRFWALNLTSYGSHAVSSSNICANFVQTCLGAPGSGWSRKENGSFFFPTVMPYLFLTSLKVCDWSGHIFGASASPKSLTKKRLCHPLPLIMAVSMIPNMWHSSCERMRHSWLTKFWGFMLEPARMCCRSPKVQS